MIERILIYALAIFVGMGVGLISGFPFGMLLSAIPRLPLVLGGNQHFGKFYLHGLWFLTAFASTLTSYGIVRAFSLEVGFGFVFLLMLQPAFVFNSARLRKPENLGYFNLLASSDAASQITQHKILTVNRMEAITKVFSICLCLYIVAAR